MEYESDTSLISKKFWKYVINLKRGRGRVRVLNLADAAFMSEAECTREQRYLTYKVKLLSL